MTFGARQSSVATGKVPGRPAANNQQAKLTASTETRALRPHPAEAEPLQTPSTGCEAHKLG